MTISIKVKEYIANKGIKMSDLAKDMGVSKQNLNGILSKDDMKVSTLEKIAEALGLSVAYFYEKTEKSTLEQLIEDKINEALERKAQESKI